jgi:hypothetical protein
MATYPPQYEDETDEVDEGADSEEYDHTAMMAANRLFKHYIDTTRW